MGLRFIRQPSETPNVGNADDTRMIRYAYGNYNGYIKEKGAELNYTINGLNFKINSGVVVLQGYETEIDSNGWEMTVANIGTKRFFSVWYEVNLATQTVKIDSTYDTAGFPTVQSGDDLTSASTGTARLLLYQFTATSGVIAEVSKKVSEISYAKTLIENEALARESADTAIMEGIEDGTIKAYKAIRDENGDIIHDTYRKKSERVLFFSGSTSVGGGALITRNMGNKTLAVGDALEIEFSLDGQRMRQTVILKNDAVFLQWALGGTDNILSACTAYFFYNNSTSLQFGAPNKTSWNISTKTGEKTTPTLIIYKIWVVE